MDLVAWLWERVERRDAPALLAHALNTPTIRDALLREAAVRDGWSQLAHAAEDAAEAAGEVNWSRHSPDAVAAICRWIAADQTLRRIPAYDQAWSIAQAALAAWANPETVAARLTAGSAVSVEDAEGFENVIRAEAGMAAHGNLLEELAARVQADPAFAARALSEPGVSRVLLRRAARSGDWRGLSEAAEAADGLDADRSRDAEIGAVRDICGWMLGKEANCPDPRWTYPHEMADALAHDPPLGEPEAARLRDLMTDRTG